MDQMNPNFKFLTFSNFQQDYKNPKFSNSQKGSQVS